MLKFNWWLICLSIILISRNEFLVCIVWTLYCLYFMVLVFFLLNFSYMISWSLCLKEMLTILEIFCAWKEEFGNWRMFVCIKVCKVQTFVLHDDIVRYYVVVVLPCWGRSEEHCSWVAAAQCCGDSWMLQCAMECYHSVKCNEKSIMLGTVFKLLLILNRSIVRQGLIVYLIKLQMV